MTIRKKKKRGSNYIEKRNNDKQSKCTVCFNFWSDGKEQKKQWCVSCLRFKQFCLSLIDQF